MGRINGFDHFADQLEELAEDFDKVRRGKGGKFTSTEDAIRRGMENSLDLITDQARLRAKRHVPDDHAEQIDHEFVSFEGSPKTYRHRYFSTSDLVGYHEFGTGGRADHPTKSGTVEGTDHQGRRGYVIQPQGDTPLSFPESRWDGPEEFVDDNGFVNFEFVVHPGVTAQHFMQQSLDMGTRRIENDVGEELDNIGDAI